MILIVRWIINALALLLVASILPGFQLDGFYAALVVAVILGLANAIVRPIILLLTLPITILTLGFFALVINGFMLWLVSTVVKGFTIDTFGTAVWAAIILWIISWVTNSLFERH